MPLAMVDMELDDEDKMDLAAPMATGIAKDVPQYPWGLRITLTDKELRKLGISIDEFFIDGIVHGHFLGRITSISKNQDGAGAECCRAEITLENLALEDEDAENREYE